MQYLKENVRQRIINSALIEFKQNGYSNASIRNIAENSNISLGNIYRYFENKRSIFLSIVNPFLEGIGDLAQSYNADRTQKTDFFVNYLTEHRDHFIIVKLWDAQMYSHLLDDVVDIFSTKFETSKIKAAYRNPNFTRAIISSYLEALYQVIINSSDAAQCKEYAYELTNYFFYRAD